MVKLINKPYKENLLLRKNPSAIFAYKINLKSNISMINSISNK